MNDKSCTVILPTYNEEENIVNMVTCLREMYPEFKILIMDDNSKDRSKELVENLNDDMVTFVTRDINDKGLSASICEGIMTTDTEFFINMDSDFQHPPSALGPIYEKLCEEADLCVGVRDDRVALGFIRWAGSWAFHMLASSVLMYHGKKKSKDIMSGLFGGRRDVFGSVVEDNISNFEIKGFKTLFDLLKYAPKDIVISETYYQFGERQGGESKLSPTVIASALRQCGIFGKLFAKMYLFVKG